MNERRLLSPLPPDVLSPQRQASDPAAHVWVTANAGSGKTHVLTQRVLRLLLSGVAPEAILCLTYTKAAAAEMRRRVSARLGAWAVMPELELARTLRDLAGAAPTSAELRRARTLFAHALDTPGGLRIATVHAYCEAVLHRFPVEAGVPLDFAVLEEHERADTILAAREAVLSGGLSGDDRLADAVETLFELLSDFSLTDSIESALGEPRRLAAVLADRAGAKARLRELVRHDPGETREAIEAEIVAGHPFDAGHYRDILNACPPSAGGVRFEDKLAGAMGRVPSAELLLAVFLTKDGNAPKTFPTKAMRQAVPHLADALRAEAERLEALFARLRRAELVARSEALVDVLGAIDDRYQARKRARSLLDFDDLVAKTVALLENPALGPWVRFKLDAAIDHILVDESQDTNAEQWAVIEALAEEFFAGEGAVSRPRTIFAVGDAKQSIFSFQGAEPALFGAAGSYYAAQARGAGASFATVPLQASFRTLPAILEAVDAVFAQTGMSAALLDVSAHRTARADPGGTVTLWPPIQQPGDDTPADDWPTAVQPADRSAARQVADRIAGQIESWIATARPLGARGRPVRADDVLILVQMRNALFREIIRALHKRGIPTPGADRLEVTGHIAVLDLLALGDVVLNPRDDLQLAALLRSPLYDLSQDDLFAIAQPRQGALWDALKHTQVEAGRAAHAELSALRRGLAAERPFEFYARVLYEAGGLQRFHRRFGREVDDLFSEFLDLALQHEQQAQPSLQGFLAAMRTREVEIRRELSDVGSGVRVMTVHGAKGLEAPIVILADAVSKPMGSQLQKKVYMPLLEGGPTLIHASRSDAHVAETIGFKEAHEAAQKAEYWRKLYVGMTRAEDELYITGTLTRTGKPEGTWYEAVETALRPLAESQVDAAGTETALVYPAVRPAPAPATTAAAVAAAETGPLVLGPAPARTAPETIRPSRAHAPADAERVLLPAAAEVVDAETARRRGIALHALLQHLAPLAPDARQAAALRALPVLLPDDPGAGDLLARALGLLANPALAEVFGPMSRAEVPFAATARRRGTPVRLVGRIDRLVVTPERCLIVDFKSDAQPAIATAAIREGYVAQLALYALVARELFPSRSIEAAILWTATETLMKLTAMQLREGAEGFTMA